MGIKLSHILGNHHGVDDYLIEMTPIIFIVKSVCKFFFFSFLGLFKMVCMLFVLKFVVTLVFFIWKMLWLQI